MTLRKTFEGDFKKMELTWGTAESEAKDRSLWRKRNAALSPTDRGNKRMKPSLIRINFICSNQVKTKEI